jgi:hypothetical protein
MVRFVPKPDIQRQKPNIGCREHYALSGRCRWVKIKNIAHPAIERAMLIAPVAGIGRAVNQSLMPTGILVLRQARSLC